MCERAARVIGLNICGLDVILPDIGKAFQGRGGIVEVNAAPGIRMHQSPSKGLARDAAAAIVDMLFPHGSDGRIPVVAITGRNGKTATTRMIGNILSLTSGCVGQTTSRDMSIGGQQVATGDMARPGRRASF